MRIFVAGATGAIGRPLIRRLAGEGHDVFGTTRDPRNVGAIGSVGASAVIVDALDPDATARAVAKVEPEVIVHQLTALSGPVDTRRPGRWLARTNRLRIEATDSLVAAGRAAGTRRFVAQSDAGWPSARSGGRLKSESDPLDEEPPEQLRQALSAIRHLEGAVLGAAGMDGLVLRYGLFYGPGTMWDIEPDGNDVAAIRARRFPVIGGGGGVWSFVHIDDAVDATVRAVSVGAPGIYNIVDDAPTAVGDMVPKVAEAIGAKAPVRLPRWLGRLVAGQTSAILMTEGRGATNEKARRELGWRPRQASVWRYLADRDEAELVRH